MHVHASAVVHPSATIEPGAVVQSGAVKIPIDQRYALEDVQQAHRVLEARKTTGCTILTL